MKNVDSLYSLPIKLFFFKWKYCQNVVKRNIEHLKVTTRKRHICIFTTSNLSNSLGTKISLLFSAAFVPATFQVGREELGEFLQGAAWTNAGGPDWDQGQHHCQHKRPFMWQGPQGVSHKWSACKCLSVYRAVVYCHHISWRHKCAELCVFSMWGCVGLKSKNLLMCSWKEALFKLEIPSGLVSNSDSEKSC